MAGGDGMVSIEIRVVRFPGEYSIFNGAFTLESPFAKRMGEWTLGLGGVGEWRRLWTAGAAEARREEKVPSWDFPLGCRAADRINSFAWSAEKRFCAEHQM